MTSEVRYRLLLLAILILGLALRATGLDWGLPNALHYFSFHVDESTLLTGSLSEFGGINLFTGNFLPHSYNYGSLQYYLFNIVFAFGKAYGAIGPIFNGPVLQTHALAQAYLLGRCLVAVMGVGTIWAVYAIGRRLFGPAVGLVAALILAIMPLHVLHSHYMTVDVPATLWLTLSLVFAARILNPSEKSNSISDALLCGLFAGLSAATKYSGAIVILSLVAALIARYLGKETKPADLAKLAAIGIAGLIFGFLVACPGALLENGLFVSGVHYESEHVMHHPEPMFQKTGPGWLYIIARNLSVGLGWPLLALCLVSVVYALIKHRPADSLLAAFALPTYLLIGAAASRYTRYDVPMLPIIAIWVGRMIVELIDERQTANSEKPKFSPILSYGIVSLSLIYTLVFSVVLILPMTQPDNRDLAGAWIMHNTPADERIGFASQPWFWTASINPYFALPKPGGWLDMTPQDAQSHYFYNADAMFDPNIVKQFKPDIVEMSEFEYYDAVRLKQKGFGKFYAALKADYNPPMVFKSVHPLQQMTETDGLPTQDLPHDMLYPSPTVLIYTRK